MEGGGEEGDKGDKGGGGIVVVFVLMCTAGLKLSRPFRVDAPEVEYSRSTFLLAETSNDEEDVVAGVVVDDFVLINSSSADRFVRYPLSCCVISLSGTIDLRASTSYTLNPLSSSGFLFAAARKKRLCKIELGSAVGATPDSNSSLTVERTDSAPTPSKCHLGPIFHSDESTSFSSVSKI